MPKGNYKRYALVGPGGIKCPCCCTKGYKPTLKRQAKRREQRAVMREAEAFFKLCASLPTMRELLDGIPQPTRGLT